MNDIEKFLCKLALELHMPLIEVHNLPLWEIRRWQEYFSETPFTSDRVEHQLAQIAFILYNANSSKPLDFDDFLLMKRKSEKEDRDTIITKLEMLRVMFGRKE